MEHGGAFSIEYRNYGILCRPVTSVFMFAGVVWRLCRIFCESNEKDERNDCNMVDNVLNNGAGENEQLEDIKTEQEHSVVKTSLKDILPRNGRNREAWQ